MKEYIKPYCEKEAVICKDVITSSKSLLEKIADIDISESIDYSEEILDDEDSF